MHLDAELAEQRLGAEAAHLDGPQQWPYLPHQRPSSDVVDSTIEHNANAKVTKVTRDGMVWDYAYSVSDNTATMVVTDPNGDTKTVISDR